MKRKKERKRRRKRKRKHCAKRGRRWRRGGGGEEEEEEEEEEEGKSAMMSSVSRVTTLLGTLVCMIGRYDGHVLCTVRVSTLCGRVCRPNGSVFISRFALTLSVLIRLCIVSVLFDAMMPAMTGASEERPWSHGPL